MTDRILVTGGFGFIGTHLVEALLEEEKVSVHVVDSLVTSPVDVDAYVGALEHRSRLTYDLCSVRDYHDANRPPDYSRIYHLASVVGPVGVLKHAGNITGDVVADAYRVMDLAKRSGAKLLDVSTSEVYGGGRDGYCSERDFKVIQPKVTVRLEYAVAKLAAEVAIINTAAISPLNAVIVRPFNVAGPRQSGEGGFVLPRFISQALENKPLTVYGDGRMVRAFTHVHDIADGLIAVMERGQSGEAYNLGNPANKTSILGLARRVIDVLGSGSKIEMVDPKKLFGPLFEEANDKYPDSDMAVTQLGWHPKFTMDQVIRDAAEYMREGRRD